MACDSSRICRASQYAGKAPRRPCVRTSAGFWPRLDRALVNLPARFLYHNLLWDIRKLPTLRSLVAHIDGSVALAEVEVVLLKLTDEVLPKLSSFPNQVIHNDFNRKNILVDFLTPEFISGIIDFGDMILAPRVIDLSVAVARNIDIENAPTSACEIIRGYDFILKLRGEEIASLFWLICGRLVLRSIIWSWRKTKGDLRYDTADIPSTLELLNSLQLLGEDKLTKMFQSACDA